MKPCVNRAIQLSLSVILPVMSMLTTLILFPYDGGGLLKQIRLMFACTPSLTSDDDSTYVAQFI